MSVGGALARMSEAKLRVWLLARMRGEREDPPVTEGRLETPDDYVRLVHHESSDARFHARLEKAVVAALGEAAAGDLREGPDARAVRYLAALADNLEIRAAAPVLLAIAERGAFGGHEGALEVDAEDLVLFALAGLQEPRALWAKWQALWQSGTPRLWPVVSAGLRLSDPKPALAILRKAVERAVDHPGFPLGEILWAFATDSRESYRPEEIAGALEGLPPQALQRCRDALESVGAEEGEIEAWIPAPSSGVWWKPERLLPRRPPRLNPDKMDKTA